MCQPGRPGPQGEGQEGSPGFAAFHSTKSAGRGLVLVHLDPRPGAERLHPVPRQLPVLGKTGDLEADVSPFGAVGIPLALEVRDEVEHAFDVLRGPGLPIRGQDPERLAVLVHRGDEPLRHRLEGLAVLVGPRDDLVVDVRDVADVRQPVSAMAKVPRHHVKYEEHPGVAEMAVVVDRHAADVHADPAFGKRAERFLASSERVVDMQHRPVPRIALPTGPAGNAATWSRSWRGSRPGRR